MSEMNWEELSQDRLDALIDDAKKEKERRVRALREIRQVQRNERTKYAFHQMHVLLTLAPEHSESKRCNDSSTTAGAGCIRCDLLVWQRHGHLDPDYDLIVRIIREPL